MRMRPRPAAMRGSGANEPSLLAAPRPATAGFSKLACRCAGCREKPSSRLAQRRLLPTTRTVFSPLLFASRGAAAVLVEAETRR
ncbi:hypothetical protein DIPPA_32018 [Diplonema papillatum]|nr:hypothetical protein DIPPA_32018 [Diplonema papillatum]